MFFVLFVVLFVAVVAAAAAAVVVVVVLWCVCLLCCVCNCVCIMLCFLFCLLFYLLCCVCCIMLCCVCNCVCLLCCVCNCVCIMLCFLFCLLFYLLSQVSTTMCWRCGGSRVVSFCSPSLDTQILFERVVFRLMVCYWFQVGPIILSNSGIYRLQSQTHLCRQILRQPHPTACWHCTQSEHIVHGWTRCVFHRAVEF